MRQSISLWAARSVTATANTPGDLRLGRGGGAVTEAVRSGRRGMPAYSADLLSDQEFGDLSAYLNTNETSGPGSGEGVPGGG